MKLSPHQASLLKILFALMGGVGLHLILRDFGYTRILRDIGSLGLKFVPIALSFTFLFGCLSLAWWVLLGRRISYFYLFLVSLVANAWNNIGPVSKSLGEPTRVLLLTGRMPVREAVRSMMLYNLAQAMGTMLTFGLGAALAPLLFDLSNNAFTVTVASAILSIIINGIALLWIFSRPKGRKPPTRGRTLRSLLHWLRWISHQLRKYTRLYPWRYFTAVGLTATGRLSEGLVFFAIFQALGHPLSLTESIAVDVGRGIADNIFFFVPYQLGTREFSIAFITQSILGRGEEVAVAASLVFRLAEISWIVLGFLIGLWLLRKKIKHA